MVTAQVQGGSQVIDAAVRHSWEAGAVAIVLVVMLIAIGYLMRALWNVNVRLAARVTNLEDQLTTKLMLIVEDTTKAVSANTVMLDRTARVMEKLEAMVEQLLHAQQDIVARIETSPCLMVTALSEETKGILKAAREAAAKANKETDNG